MSALHDPTPTRLMGLLAEIDQRSRASGLGLPETNVYEEVWDGLAYSVGGVRVVSAMSEVIEMLPYPTQITPVPGVKSWMLGLANVRGSLLPVIDLQLFFGVNAVIQGKMARMLVIRMRGVNAGLLVPAVLGMRHYKEKQRMSNARMQGALGTYVYDAFSVEDQIVPVFSLAALSADPEFRGAAL